MRSLFLGLGLLLAVFLSPHRVEAQAIVLPCVPSGSSCIPVSAANPLPITGGGIIVGTTSITGGTAGCVLYQASSMVACDATITATASGGTETVVTNQNNLILKSTGANPGQITSQTGGGVLLGRTGIANYYSQDASGNLTYSGPTILFTGLGTDATHTDTTLCQDTTTHSVLTGSGTAGICLGNVSSIRFKNAWTPLNDSLSVIMSLNPGTWLYKPGIADGGARLQIGFLAEEYARVLPDWTRYDEHGTPNGDDLVAVIPQAVRAIQQLNHKIDELAKRLAEAEAKR